MADETVFRRRNLTRSNAEPLKYDNNAPHQDGIALTDPSGTSSRQQRNCQSDPGSAQRSGFLKRNATWRPPRSRQRPLLLASQCCSGPCMLVGFKPHPIYYQHSGTTILDEHVTFVKDNLILFQKFLILRNNAATTSATSSLIRGHSLR